MNQYGQHGALVEYRVTGNLIGHDGFRANFIEDTAKPINPEVIQVDEHVFTAEGESGAIDAAGYKARVRSDRSEYYWQSHPKVSRVIEEDEQPEDQRLRQQGAPTLPGLEEPGQWAEIREGE